jgi:putative transcriptional regulator
MESRVGKLLIAHPNLPKHDWFHKTVVYIYSDSPQQGTLGLTLNVRTNVTVKRLFNDKGIIYPSEYPSVYKGGPVTEQSIIMLHTPEWASTNTIPAGSSYRISSDTLMFQKLSLGDQPAYWRMFLGLAAWAPNQLDRELSSSFGWLMCEANDDILFNYSEEEQWEAALALSSQQMINSFF